MQEADDPAQQVTRVLAIRHGETAWNVDTRMQGQLDIPLNETGRWQARRLALALADEGISAVYSSDGPIAPRRAATLLAPAPAGEAVGISFEVAAGEYRAGDALWLDKLAPAEFAKAVNRDVLVPRSAGRFVFGRLAAVDGGKLQILPISPGARQVVVADAVWLAVARTLIRAL